MPEASRFIELDYFNLAFGAIGMTDKAKQLAALHIEDLTNFRIECIAPSSEVSRYEEQLVKSANSFNE